MLKKKLQEQESPQTFDPDDPSIITGNDGEVEVAETSSSILPQVLEPERNAEQPSYPEQPVAAADALLENLASKISLHRVQRAKNATYAVEGAFVKILVDGREIGQVQFPKELKRPAKFHEVQADMLNDPEFAEVIRRFANVNKRSILYVKEQPDGGHAVVTTDGAKYTVSEEVSPA